MKIMTWTFWNAENREWVVKNSCYNNSDIASKAGGVWLNGYVDIKLYPIFISFGDTPGNQ